MKILKTERKLCMCCMEEHEVQIVDVHEKLTFKGKKVEYNAIYKELLLKTDIKTKEEIITIKILNNKQRIITKIINAVKEN